LGNYAYGDTHHLHAATSVSSGYTATYDAAGDMQCPAPSSATTCSGAPTGQSLTWDVEGRLANWQNATTNPTVTAKYLYDGEGNRVVQQVVDSTAGSTTTTSYVGSLETYFITTGNQPTNITTTDYASAGKVLAESVNGTLSYLATSYQGSVVAALDSSGNVGVTASQLYAPYGGVRYASGALPTDYGYTGQRVDSSTGLDYYGARYYDPTLGQFTSADTLLAGGSNRYGYVGGNPTTATDPAGR
jgi:RHS repeat-associated protein